MGSLMVCRAEAPNLPVKCLTVWRRSSRFGKYRWRLQFVAMPSYLPNYPDENLSKLNSELYDRKR